MKQNSFLAEHVTTPRPTVLTTYQTIPQITLTTTTVPTIATLSICIFIINIIIICLESYCSQYMDIVIILHSTNNDNYWNIVNYFDIFI